jgi:hypothetical protein
MTTQGQGFPGDLPSRPTDEEIETAQRLRAIHQPDSLHRCTTLTCAVGAYPVPWPCRRWRWSTEILRRAGHPTTPAGY